MLCRGKTGSLCFLPARIKYSNWHSTTGCEGSGLDSRAWKAAFHPISSLCWVLGLFIVTQLCHFYLSCSSYRRYLSPTARIWPSFSIFMLWSIVTWFIDGIPVCMLNTTYMTLHVSFTLRVAKWALFCQSHVTWHSQLTAAGPWTWHTSKALVCSDWWREHCF